MCTRGEWRELIGATFVDIIEVPAPAIWKLEVGFIEGDAALEQLEQLLVDLEISVEMVQVDDSPKCPLDVPAFFLECEIWHEVSTCGGFYYLPRPSFWSEPVRMRVILTDASEERTGRAPLRKCAISRPKDLQNLPGVADILRVNGLNSIPEIYEIEVKPAPYDYDQWVREDKGTFIQLDNGRVRISEVHYYQLVGHRPKDGVKRGYSIAQLYKWRTMLGIDSPLGNGVFDYVPVTLSTAGATISMYLAGSISTHDAYDIIAGMGIPLDAVLLHRPLDRALVAIKEGQTSAEDNYARLRTPYPYPDYAKPPPYLRDQLDN